MYSGHASSVGNAVNAILPRNQCFGLNHVTAIGRGLQTDGLELCLINTVTGDGPFSEADEKLSQRSIIDALGIPHDSNQRTMQRFFFPQAIY